MIYLLLHQARSEEIKREQAEKFRYRREKISLLQRNVGTVEKFRYNSEIFAAPEFSLLVVNFAT